MRLGECNHSASPGLAHGRLPSPDSYISLLSPQQAATKPSGAPSPGYLVRTCMCFTHNSEGQFSNHSRLAPGMLKPKTRAQKEPEQNLAASSVMPEGTTVYANISVSPFSAPHRPEISAWISCFQNPATNPLECSKQAIA